jgi:hypothetical protein
MSDVYFSSDRFGFGLPITVLSGLSTFHPYSELLSHIRQRSSSSSATLSSSSSSSGWEEFIRHYVVGDI